MRKLGVKQKLVVEQCLTNGFVWTGDAMDIFNIPSKKSKRALFELKKLVVYGYLKKRNEYDDRYFILTNEAKKHCRRGI